MLKRPIWLLLLSCALFCFACSSDDKKTGDGGNNSDAISQTNSDATTAGSDATAAQADPDEGKTFTQQITAADGGTLATESGYASLDVPAGALAADTKLTVKVEAAASGTASSVYDFGPDGTQFSKPVDLTIKYNATPPTDKKPVLAMYDQDKWVEISGSSFADGKVTAKVEHFTKFSVIIVDNKVVLTSSCGDVADKFSACGGDIVGSWKIADYCVPNTILGDVPFTNCSEAKWEVDMDWKDAVITITSTTSEISAYTMVSKVTLFVPKTCIDNQPCTEIGDDFGACTEESGVCKCTKTTEKEIPASPATNYTIEGNSIVSTTGEVTTKSPYCVQGDKAIIEMEMQSKDLKYKAYFIIEKTTPAP